MFHVVLRRSGPQWDPSRPMEEQSDWAAHASFMDGLVDEGFIVLGGPLADEHRVVHVVEAESEDAVRATLARDPWLAAYALGSLAHGGFSELVSDVDLGLIVSDPRLPEDDATIQAVADAERSKGSTLHERLSVF